MSGKELGPSKYSARPQIPPNTSSWDSSVCSRLFTESWRGRDRDAKHMRWSPSNNLPRHPIAIQDAYKSCFCSCVLAVTRGSLQPGLTSPLCTMWTRTGSSSRCFGTITGPSEGVGGHGYLSGNFSISASSILTSTKNLLSILKKFTQYHHQSSARPIATNRPR